MTATVIIMPVISRPSFRDPAWREQFERESLARCVDLRSAPPRTRPLLVVRNEPEAGGIFQEVLRRVQSALDDES